MSRMCLVLGSYDPACAVPVEHVQRVLSRDDWGDARTLHLESLGVRVRDLARESRIVLVQSATGSIPLLATGSLTPRSFTAEQISPLPTWLLSSAPFSSLLLEAGEPFALLLDPTRLSASWDQAETPMSNSAGNTASLE